MESATIRMRPSTILKVKRGQRSGINTIKHNTWPRIPIGKLDITNEKSLLPWVQGVFVLPSSWCPSSLAIILLRKTAGCFYCFCGSLCSVSLP